MAAHIHTVGSRSRQRPTPAGQHLVRRLATAVAVAAGIALVLIGVRLPWLTLFGGLQPLSAAGTLNGSLLEVGAVIAGAASLFAIAIRSRWPSTVAMVAAVGVLGFCAYLAFQLIATLRATDPLVIGQPGPGLLVSAGGALLILVANVGARLARTPGQRSVSIRDHARTPVAAKVAAAGLLFAGVIHLVLTPSHFAASPILGTGFGAAGIAELGLAWLLLARPTRLVAAAVVGVASGLVLLYAVNVTIGLPIPHAGPVAASTEHGHGEPAAHGSSAEASHTHAAVEVIDLPGVLVKTTELVAIGGALTLLAGRAASPQRS